MEAFETPFDEIRIQGWILSVAIGVYEHEKLGKQDLELDLVICGDFRTAGRTDDLDQAVDYAVLKADFETWSTERRWQLLEAFGEQACDWILSRRLIKTVRLTIKKPAALAPALVSYTLTRKK